MTRKTNDANLFAIERDVTPFEKDAQARDATLFWRRVSGSGMEELLVEAVSRLDARILIISDANSVFIQHILTIRNLHHLVIINLRRVQ